MIGVDRQLRALTALLRITPSRPICRRGATPGPDGGAQRPAEGGGLGACGWTDWSGRILDQRRRSALVLRLAFSSACCVLLDEATRI